MIILKQKPRPDDIAISPSDRKGATQIVRMLVGRSRRGGWLESVEFEDVRLVLRLLGLPRPSLMFGQVNYVPRMLRFLPLTHKTKRKRDHVAVRCSIGVSHDRIWIVEPCSRLYDGRKRESQTRFLQ